MCDSIGIIVCAFALSILEDVLVWGILIGAGIGVLAAAFWLGRRSAPTATKKRHHRT